MNRIFKNVLFILGVFALHGIAMAETHFTPNDILELKNSLLQTMDKSRITLIGIQAGKNNGKIEFRENGRLLQITFHTDITGKNKCRGPSYKSLCVEQTGGFDNYLGKQVFHLLKNKIIRQELGRVRKLIQDKKWSEAKKLLKSIPAPPKKPMKIAEIALMWLELNDQNTWGSLCNKALKIQDKLAEQDKITLWVTCGDPDAAIKAYQSMQQKKRKCLALRLIRILSTRGQTQKVLGFIKKHLDDISVCPYLAREAWMQASTKQDCDLLSSLWTKYPTTQLEQNLTQSVTNTFLKCKMTLAAIKFLMIQDRCDPNIINELIELASELKPSKDILKTIKQAQTIGTCPKKRMVLATILLKTGAFKEILDLTYSIKGNGPSKNWLLLYRALAMYGTGRGKDGQNILRNLAAGDGTPARLSRYWLDIDGASINMDQPKIPPVMKQKIRWSMVFIVLLGLAVWSWWTRKRE